MKPLMILYPMRPQEFVVWRTGPIWTGGPLCHLSLCRAVLDFDFRARPDPCRLRYVCVDHQHRRIICWALFLYVPTQGESFQIYDAILSGVCHSNCY